MDPSDYIELSPKSDVPLVAQLVDQLCWLMAAGKLKPGEMLPTIRELADQLQVNLHTVRQAYQRLQAMELVEVRRRRGTMVLSVDPHKLVQHRRGEPSFLLGVLLPAPASVYRGFTDGVHQAASEHGWMPLIAYTTDNPRIADRYFHQLLAKGVDGLIVVSNPVHVGVRSMEDSLGTLPVVHVDAPHITSNSLLVDSEHAAFLATEHLLAHGYQQVAFIGPPIEWEPVEPSYRGYLRALQAGGVEHDPTLVIEVPDFSQASGQLGVSKLLGLENPPQAAFFASDSLALGAIPELKARGLKLPDEFALTSYNDIEEAGIVTPGLTTASFPAFELGQLAVEKLLKIRSGELKEGGRIVLDTKLVIRGSCGCTQNS